MISRTSPPPRAPAVSANPFTRTRAAGHSKQAAHKRALLQNIHRTRRMQRRDLLVFARISPGAAPGYPVLPFPPFFRLSRIAQQTRSGVTGSS